MHTVKALFILLCYCYWGRKFELVYRISTRHTHALKILPSHMVVERKIACNPDGRHKCFESRDCWNRSNWFIFTCEFFFAVAVNNFFILATRIKFSGKKVTNLIIAWATSAWCLWTTHSSINAIRGSFYPKVSHFIPARTSKVITCFFLPWFPLITSLIMHSGFADAILMVGK